MRETKSLATENLERNDERCKTKNIPNSKKREWIRNMSSNSTVPRVCPALRSAAKI
jgi:hypothetical protein